MSFNGPKPIVYKESQAFPFDRMASIWKEILKGLPLRAFNAVARVHANTHLTFNNEIFSNADLLEFLEPADRVRFAQHSFKAALHLFRNPSLMETIHVDDLFAIAASHLSMKTHLINDPNRVWFPPSARRALQLSGSESTIYRYTIDWSLLEIKPEISNELWNLLLEPSNAKNIEEQSTRATLYKAELKLAVSKSMPNSSEKRIIEECQRLHPSFIFAFLTEYVLAATKSELLGLCYYSEVIANEVVRRIGRGSFPANDDANGALLKFCGYHYPSVRQYILQSPDFSFLRKIDVTIFGLINTTEEYLASAFNFISPSKKEEVKEKHKFKPETSGDDFQLTLTTLESMERDPQYYIPSSILNTVRAYGALETRLLALGPYANTVNRSAMIFDLLAAMVESLDPLKVSRMPESQPLSLHEIARLSVPVPSEPPSAKRRKIADAEPVAQPPLLSSFSLHSAPVVAPANQPEVTDDDLYYQGPAEPEVTETSLKKRKRLD